MYKSRNRTALIKINPNLYFFYKPKVLISNQNIYIQQFEFPFIYHTYVRVQNGDKSYFI